MKKFILSTERINTKRILIRTDGIILDEFLKNPLMYDCHIYDDGSLSVIGLWEELEKVDKKLLGLPVFDMEDDRAAKIAGKVERGFVRCASIGVQPLDGFMGKDENGEEYFDCTKSLLVEISIATIPANRDSFKMTSDVRIYQPVNKDFKLMDNWTFTDLPVNNQPPIQQTMDLKKIAQSLGLSETATEAEILAAVNANNSASIQLADLQKKQKDANNAEIIKLVDLRIAENPALAGMRQTYITLGDTNFEVAKATLEALAVAVPQNVTLSAIARGTVSFQNNNLQLPAGKETWTFTDWEKKDPAGLQQLRTTNPKGFETLYEQTYGIDFKTDIGLVGAVPEK